MAEHGGNTDDLRKNISHQLEHSENGLDKISDEEGWGDDELFFNDSDDKKEETTGIKPVTDVEKKELKNIVEREYDSNFKVENNSPHDIPAATDTAVKNKESELKKQFSETSNKSRNREIEQKNLEKSKERLVSDSEKAAEASILTNIFFLLLISFLIFKFVLLYELFNSLVFALGSSFSISLLFRILRAYSPQKQQERYSNTAYLIPEEALEYHLKSAKEDMVITVDNNGAEFWVKDVI